MNESARPNAFSFTADIAGTHLDAAVAVHSLDSETPSDEQIDFGHALVQRVMDAAAEYEPAEAARTETLDAYVILANTHQLIALARNSADETPSQAMRYFEDAAANLEILAEWDPRFTTAYHRVRQGEQLTGNFFMEGVEELCDSIETWLPQRLEGGGYPGRVVVVDDHQSPADFAATRTPDHEAVSVRMVQAGELSDADYVAVARSVYPVPMFPDGSLESRLSASTFVEGMHINYIFETDRDAFHLLKVLGDALVDHTSLTNDHTPAEFYIQLANAKQLCFAARTERFAADGVYRRNVLEALAYSLSVMSSFDPVYVTPLRLVRVAEELNEDISSDEVVKVASAIEGWLPREMAELIPEGWDAERSEELGGWLEHGLNVLPGGRFVAVFGKQTAEDFRETGLPDPAKLVPIVVGEEADPRLFGLPNAQVFLADI